MAKKVPKSKMQEPKSSGEEVVTTRFSDHPITGSPDHPILGND